MIDVSVIIPVKDEEMNIQSLARELSQAMDGQGWSWECLWVDDGSQDRSLEVIKRLCLEDTHHRYISFERNAGKAAAMWAAFREARGAVFADMDGDGQNDPADIPPLIRMVLSGEVDFANGYRARRRDNLFRIVSSRIGNGFRTLLTGKTVRDVGCATRAYKRELAFSLPRFSGMHRFLAPLMLMNGARIAERPVNHRPRLHGVSKYGVHNRLWVGLVDTFGVLWLRKRGFQYRIARSSEALHPEGHD